MGCRFSPSDADLICAYLRPMIACEPLPEPAARFLHTADAYAADPGFCPALASPGRRERRLVLLWLAKALPQDDSAVLPTAARAPGTPRREGRPCSTAAESSGTSPAMPTDPWRPCGSWSSSVWLMIMEMLRPANQFRFFARSTRARVNPGLRPSRREYVYA
ncbi:hypothetical protein ZWY2020_015962 [Hordeum vulgare]|nr:hypothetical protein ZWY2020_015962 [Hordeum vulgare]